MGSMASIVFFRGINVGGHRAFRPSLLAKELDMYDAVNVGAAGTLVVHKPGLRTQFLPNCAGSCPLKQQLLSAMAGISFNWRWRIRLEPSHRPRMSFRVWAVPPPHENDRLSRADRQAFRGAGGNAQLEHNTLGSTNSEVPRSQQGDRLCALNASCAEDVCELLKPGAQASMLSSQETPNRSSSMP